MRLIGKNGWHELKKDFAIQSDANEQEKWTNNEIAVNTNTVYYENKNYIWHTHTIPMLHGKLLSKILCIEVTNFDIIL